MPNNNGKPMRNTVILPNKITLTNNGIIVIIINPLATPLSTSIEFIVLPTIGIMAKISGIYNIGMKALSNINPRELP